MVGVVYNCDMKESKYLTSCVKNEITINFQAQYYVILYIDSKIPYSQINPHVLKLGRKTAFIRFSGNI